MFRDILLYVMYYICVMSGLFLLVEPTDSMIPHLLFLPCTCTRGKVIGLYKNCLTSTSRYLSNLFTWWIHRNHRNTGLVWYSPWASQVVLYWTHLLPIPMLLCCRPCAPCSCTLYVDKDHQQWGLGTRLLLLYTLLMCSMWDMCSREL